MRISRPLFKPKGILGKRSGVPSLCVALPMQPYQTTPLFLLLPVSLSNWPVKGSSQSWLTQASRTQALTLTTLLEYHTFFIHSAAGRLGCSYLLAVVENAGLTVREQICKHLLKSCID